MLSKDIRKLGVAERIVLAEDLWDSVASRPMAASPEEVAYVKQRLDDLKRSTTTWRTWREVKASMKP